MSKSMDKMFNYLQSKRSEQAQAGARCSGQEEMDTVTEESICKMLKIKQIKPNSRNEV